VAVFSPLATIDTAILELIIIHVYLLNLRNNISSIISTFSDHAAIEIFLKDRVLDLTPVCYQL
jgi:hypothetical protein